MTTPKKKILPKTNTGDIIEGFGFAGGPRGFSRSAKIKEVQIKPKKSLQNQKPKETSQYDTEKLPPNSKIISAEEIMAPKPPNYPPGSQHYSSKLKYLGKTKMSWERNKIISAKNKLKVKKKK